MKLFSDILSPDEAIEELKKYYQSGFYDKSLLKVTEILEKPVMVKALSEIEIKSSSHELMEYIKKIKDLMYPKKEFDFIKSSKSQGLWIFWSKIKR